jgi:hypothetical protein
MEADPEYRKKHGPKASLSDLSRAGIPIVSGGIA